LPTSVEIVNQHIVATIPVGDSQLPKQNQARNAMKTEECEVDFDYLGVHMAKLYNRDELPFGQKIEGPALIADNSTSTLLPPGHDAEKDAYGNIIITKNK
jgi:N-methylhydantoinase A